LPCYGSLVAHESHQAWRQLKLFQAIATLPRFPKPARKNTVIVPGGGAFADQVRMAQHNWQFDDSTAHSMALLAMQQMALLFKSLKPEFAIAGSVPEIKRRLQENTTVIWSPERMELDQAGIAASWDVTSDSLAAWLAGALNADKLILVKSAVIDIKADLKQLADQGVIDNAFCDMIKNKPFKIDIVNADRFTDALT